MSGSEPSRSSVFAARLVTLFFILSVAVAAALVAKGILGTIRGDQSVAIRQSISLEDLEQLPAGAVGPSEVSVTVRVRDANAEQVLYAMARDLVPALVVIAVLWLLRAVLASVRHGDPFTRANVRRLRVIGFVLLIGVPVATVAWSGLQEALSATIGASGSGLVFSLPGAGPVAALFVFVLAQVFAHGVALREDVEGTV